MTEETKTKRTSRETQTREKTARRKPWAPPSMLEAPPAPEGFVHRWVRTAIRGEDDKTNLHARLREGWEPVRADEYPDFEAPTVDDGKYQGVIGNGGLILCRMPIETVDERTEYFRDQTRNQMKAVDENLMREQHPSMPITQDRQSRVTFGGEKK
tara:strand:- start:699 stop:1163 length:465 start_codon:yes stop_codon:yes gene_type:complete